MTKHANQRVVDLDEATIRTAEKETFLDVVEQFPIAALGFATISDVLEYVDSLEAFAAGGVDLGRGDQIRAFQHRMQIFVGECAGAAAEGARARGDAAAQGKQSTHVDSN